MPHPICDIADTRVLVQMDDDVGNRKFRDLLCALLEPIGEYIDVLDAIFSVFDLETAEGDQLDKIGAWLDLPRAGFDDIQYRRNLQIQVKIIKAINDEGNWTGTVNNLLEIIRIFIGPIPGVIQYVPLPPYSFLVSIPGGLSLLETQQLFDFIRRSLYAGVLGLSIFLQGDNPYWAHAFEIAPGIGDWDVGAVTDEALWGAAEQPLLIFSSNAAGNVFIDISDAFRENDGSADFAPFVAENLEDAACYFGLTQKFYAIYLDHNAPSVQGAGSIIVWEYWNGATWTTFMPTDGTVGFTSADNEQFVTWSDTMMIDWETTSVNGSDPLYWIRARIDTTFTALPTYIQGFLGIPPEGPIGEWLEGSIAQEGLWSAILSTSTDKQHRNDNT